MKRQVLRTSMAVLLLAGVDPARAQPQASPLKGTLDEASLAFSRNDLETAERHYREVLQSATELDLPRDIVLARNGIGSVYSRKFLYREAFASWIEARDTALKHGLNAEAAAVLVNLASVHLQINNVSAAEPLVQQAIGIMSRLKAVPYRHQIILALAMIRARQNRLPEALPIFAEAAEAADRAGDDKSLALIQNAMGSALLQAGRWREAERVIQESFRWRLLRKDVDLYNSYFNLAQIELARGNHGLALTLANRSLALARGQAFPLSQIRHLLARILIMSHRRREADTQLHAAIDDAWRLRLEVLPADQFRLGSEFRLSDLYEDALENAAVLYETGQDKLALGRVWIAASERRSYLMRTSGLTQEQLRNLLPAVYWEQLAGLRRLETQRIIGALPASGGLALDRLRVHLAELESSAGIRAKSNAFREKIGQIKTLNPFLSRLSKDSVLISFHLGTKRSHRWELTKAGLSWKALASRGDLVSLTGRFEKAVRRNEPAAHRLGMELYSNLFGELSVSATKAEHWLLDLDGALFGAPLAASVSGAGAAAGSPPHFLVEDHTLRVFPGAAALLEDGPAGTPGRMLAIADPVYNRADGRSSTAKNVAFRGSRTGVAEELPRLPGSRVEAESCAAIWGRDSSTVLTGSEVRRSRIEEELMRSPSIVHVAAHVLANPGAPDRSLLAIGLNENGQMEVLGTTDVMLLPASGSLVVLSGCHSASGTSLPGGGWLGMTRAWMLSGANAVVASQWPTPDDTGLLFQEFYRVLREEDLRAGGSLSFSAAVALRQSQMKMARSNTWRAHPNYWATYQLTVRTQ